MLDLLTEVGDLAELNRLLAGFNRRGRNSLSTGDLIELARQTAGANYRYPNPEPTLRLALEVGFLAFTRKRIVMTPLGVEFRAAALRHSFDISKEQGFLLFGLLLDDLEMSARISKVISFFGADRDNSLKAQSLPTTWDRLTQSVAKTLQQLGAIYSEDGDLVLDGEFEARLPAQILKKAVLGEEELWKRLERQRLRAREAEEYVLKQEQRRLASEGRRDLADLVLRVSLDNVGAGYDIQSFGSDESNRYIEVKSSIGRAIQFEWSVAERSFAREHADEYWIYFVPFSHELTSRASAIVIIANPVALIKKGWFLETETTYAVHEAKRTGFFAHRKPWIELVTT